MTLYEVTYPLTFVIELVDAPEDEGNLREVLSESFDEMVWEWSRENVPHPDFLEIEELTDTPDDGILEYVPERIRDA